MSPTDEPEPGPTFEDLGLDKRVLRALKDAGYESPSPIQAATIGARRRHHASSPFQPQPEPEIKQYGLDDLVSHDSYGVGRVVGVEAHAVTVDFRNQTVRITSPYHKMARL